MSLTKDTWASRFRHDTDATYQEWRDDYIARCSNMTYLAADETNITPGAGARPSVNTEGGYAVYHLNDSLHGTAPIYIRFGFGTHGTATFPRIQVTVGTSTNGSGVLGGTCLSTITQANGNVAQITDTVRNSYISSQPGFFGFNWKQGAGISESLIIVARMADSAGAPSATAGLLVASNGNGTIQTQAFRYASTAAAYTMVTNPLDTVLGFFPQARASSLVGSDIQVALAWIPTPAAAPVMGICGVLAAEVGTGSTFSATLYGSTPHTYIGLSSTNSFGTAAGASPGYPKFAMLWE